MTEFEISEAPQPPAPKKKHRFLIVLTVLVTVAVLGVGGWFGVSAYQDHKHEQQRIAAAKAKAKADAKAAAKAEAEHKAAVATCKRELGDYMDALTEIDARLDVGLTAHDLASRAGDAAVQKSHVDESVLPDFCQQAKDKADQALDDYSTTASEWDDCIWDDYCDPDTDLDLQTPWQDATDALDEAKTLMTGSGEES